MYVFFSFGMGCWVGIYDFVLCVVECQKMTHRSVRNNIISILELLYEPVHIIIIIIIIIIS
jgi:hypothetical protein